MKVYGQLEKAQLENVTATPTAGKAGRLVFRTDTAKIKVDDGTQFLEVVDLASAQTLTNKTLTSPAITTPTGIVKGDVGLGNVDNTSDTAKPASTAQQTAPDLNAD